MFVPHASFAFLLEIPALQMVFTWFCNWMFCISLYCLFFDQLVIKVQFLFCLPGVCFWILFSVCFFYKSLKVVMLTVLVLV